MKITFLSLEIFYTAVNFDKYKVKLQVWNSDNQELFRAISKSYFRNAVGINRVFELTHWKSFEDFIHWFNNVHAPLFQIVQILKILKNFILILLYH
jgi:GTPase SAR1 family protein